jgi:hypothetical protein
MIKKLIKYLLPVVVFLGLFLLFSYKLFYSFTFHPDFARDIYDILSIIQGKLTLIGPKLSFGGIYSGPYYYYLFAPVFYLTRLNLNSLLVFNLFLFLAGVIIFYLIIPKKSGIFFPLIACLVLTFLPFYVIGSRGPWNGSTYLPFLLIFLAMIHFFDFNGKKILLLGTGFLGGVIMSVHLVNIPAVFLVIIYLLIFLKNKKEIIFFLIGLLIAFMPLLFFEIKHDFVMTKNTLLVGSYRTFVNNNNIPNAVSGKKNIFDNLIFLSGKLSEEIGYSILLFIAVGVFLLLNLKEKKEKFLIYGSFALIIFFAAVSKYQFSGHYLYPVSLFLIFSLTVGILKTKYKWLLIILLILELFSFPKNIYNKSQRIAKTFENRVNYVINNHLIKSNESFNVIQISKDYSTYIPVGHEYRFFFRKNKYFPKTEFEYKSSDTLLIFSELKNFDISKMDNWEIREFGLENIQKYKKYEINEAVLYVSKKNQ